MTTIDLCLRYDDIDWQHEIVFTLLAKIVEVYHFTIYKFLSLYFDLVLIEISIIKSLFSRIYMNIQSYSWCLFLSNVIWF